MLRNSFTVALLASWAGATRLGLMDQIHVSIEVPDAIMKQIVSPNQIVVASQAATDAAIDTLLDPEPILNEYDALEAQMNTISDPVAMLVQPEATPDPVPIIDDPDYMADLMRFDLGSAGRKANQ